MVNRISKVLAWHTITNEVCSCALSKYSWAVVYHIWYGFYMGLEWPDGQKTLVTIFVFLTWFQSLVTPAYKKTLYPHPQVVRCIFLFGTKESLFILPQLKTVVLLNEVWDWQHIFFSVAEVMPVRWHFYSPILASKKQFPLEARAVRLIEIEIKSRFEIARFLNRFIARFLFYLFFAPCPNLPQYAIHTNPNAAEQNRPGIQTDSMLKKQGRWVQNRIRTWWPKKCMLHAEHTAGSSDHISFRAESVFLKIPLRLLNTLSSARSAQNALW